MSLKGQYVRDHRGVTGMIESDEPDLDGFVMVYYGTLDSKQVRQNREVILLEPIDSPLNCRIQGRLPSAELAPPPEVVVG